MTKASKVLRVFFWIAFAAFLAASIPHVAWFFSVYELHNADGSLDAQYWFVSYAIAVSIDVTTFLLSMTVAGMTKQKKKKSLIFSVWLFILVLAGLSWFINGKYALHFQENGVIAPSPVTISFFGWGSWHFQDINPIIASCFQVLAVAYTWIADKIATGEAPKTAQQLLDEANELEQKAIAKERIAAVKRETAINGAAGLFDTGIAIFDHAKSRMKKQGNDTESEAVSEVESIGENTSIPERKTERITGPLAEESEEENETNPDGNEEESQEESDQETNENLALDPELLPLISRYPNCVGLLSTSDTTVWLSDVANAFDTTPVLLRNRVRNGKIRKTKNPEKVYKDSVISWAKDEMLSRRNRTIISLETARKSQEKTEEKVSG